MLGFLNFTRRKVKRTWRGPWYFSEIVSWCTSPRILLRSAGPGNSMSASTTCLFWASRRMSARTSGSADQSRLNKIKEALEVMGRVYHCISKARGAQWHMAGARVKTQNSRIGRSVPRYCHRSIARQSDFNRNCANSCSDHYRESRWPRFRSNPGRSSVFMTVRG